MQGRPEEAKSEENAGFSSTNGEARSQGAEDHQQKGESVHAPPPLEVSKPAEYQLADGGAQQRDGNQGGDDLRRGLVPVFAFAVVVIYPSNYLDDESDWEEVVGIGEEPHPCNDDGFEVVVLCPWCV